MQQIERYEQKFLVPPRMAQILKAEILPYVQLDQASLEGPYTVLSLYLDGIHLPFYQATQKRLAQRLKLRIRTYNGQHFFLEIKRKIRGMVWKSRVKLNQGQYEALFLPQESKIRFSNRLEYRRLFRHLDRTQKSILDEFLHWRDLYGAQAKMWVGYQREGFQSKDGLYARVTFDTQLKAQPAHTFVINNNLREDYQKNWYRLDYASTFKSQQADIVLELKSENLVPPWMSTLCQKYNLTTFGVSKYGLAINRFDTVCESKLPTTEFLSTLKY